MNDFNLALTSAWDQESHRKMAAEVNAVTPCRKFGASFPFITKRRLSVRFGASWIGPRHECTSGCLLFGFRQLASKRPSLRVT